MDLLKLQSNVSLSDKNHASANNVYSVGFQELFDPETHKEQITDHAALNCQFKRGKAKHQSCFPLTESPASSSPLLTSIIKAEL